LDTVTVHPEGVKELKETPLTVTTDEPPLAFQAPNEVPVVEISFSAPVTS